MMQGPAGASDKTPLILFSRIGPNIRLPWFHVLQFYGGQNAVEYEW
jgi:hypothetical protein